MNPTLCLWPLTCQSLPSCISNLSNDEKNPDGRRRGGNRGKDDDGPFRMR